ncbi:zinc-finger homeodomain protein 2-like [Andrographis paniculata]|uniref:zinc-finger homeodomain protein 2-like n=1 Tax=Andrographis paniculata TaxID=175694 RepID=UPI0021E71B34|nr:zinc-finger homeodomain protein 2-like [Andrographis paniculata]XP_051135379.1 zinc-finger homeodomain protein 2-like [Andrographis paniculata]
MEIRTQDDEIPIPLNSSYGGGAAPHIIHHDHHLNLHHHHDAAASAAAITSTTITATTTGGGPLIPTTSDDQTAVLPFKKTIKYRECLKNHAAAMGANATDGCGEFMPSGDDGTLEALTCSACGCHRNFHRKEIDGEPPAAACDNCTFHPRISGRKLFLPGGPHHPHPHPHKPYLTPEAIGYHHPSGALMPSRAVPPHHHMLMSYNLGGGGGGGPSESDDQDDANGGGLRPPQMVKKRFRTKFTQEQKDKMHNFAEKVGWKIQKQEEAVVQQFCQEIGVKRRVLKVWMHNNKHNLAKKMNLQQNPLNQNQNQTGE